MTASNLPLVSVAVATYNGARWLREQLDSIYAQTWPHLEVVVTDDASTDDTVEILGEYANERGLRYAVNPARLGLVKNFERAISLCHGDYIALSDQDDVWKPHKIETLIERIGNATLIYCNNQEFFESGVGTGIEHRYKEIRFAQAHGSGHPTRYLLAENWVVSHTVLFRHELITHALPIPPHQSFHDGWLALVASKLGGIVYIDEHLQVYRRHESSLTYARVEERTRQESFFSALLSGRFRTAWRRRCESEIRRLKDALECPLLDASDREFVGKLMTYYSSGLSRGVHWRAYRNGRRVAPFVSTLYDSRARWKFSLRALFGGL